MKIVVKTEKLAFFFTETVLSEDKYFNPNEVSENFLENRNSKYQIKTLIEFHKFFIQS